MKTHAIISQEEMYEGKEKLKPFVNMIAKCENEFDAIDTVCKIILAAKDDVDGTLEEQAIRHVNENFLVASSSLNEEINNDN